MGAHKKPKKKSTRTTTSKKSPVYPSMLTDPKELARGMFWDSDRKFQKK